MTILYAALGALLLSYIALYVWVGRQDDIDEIDW
ncbi:hypothetical protein C1Y40_04631 [Mycobacterium talmoniae]|uniref:Uncharacterized protein n=1 Tax=Mycobacterium talmoniae TaxID=1858794 RepID=A0A2S8BF04_9MYCO|nr:hypothetical protein C1Y40_04631 [Mycobacterium talmoniae]